MNRFRRILIVRNDRLGDVLLTTPVSRLLRKKIPSAHIAWWVRPYTAPLLEHNPSINQILIDNGEPDGEWIRRLRQERFDAAIVAYPRWRAAWTLWRAGIPLRVGPASKPYSALFNRRVWQHRSKGERNEADYNLELLVPLGIAFERTPTELVLLPEEQTWARQLQAKIGLAPDKPCVCLHPGSGGSSPRWPWENFMELGRRLRDAGCAILVTAGPDEPSQTDFPTPGNLTIRQLAALYSVAALVVSNSTGPLHMAVAAGTSTVSIYSPEPACHPQRWGPYPAFIEHDSRHTVLMPAPETNPLTDLSAVTVDAVFNACTKRLAGAGLPDIDTVR